MDAAASAELIDAFHRLIPSAGNAPRHEVFSRLRDDMPVFRSERLGAWVAVRYDDVVAVTTQDAVFQPPQEGLGSPAYGRTFLRMNGREHSKKIGIVGREMRSARALRDRLDGIVLRLARERAAGLPFDTPLDLREAYAAWIPLYTITELMALPDAPRFRAWYSAVVAGSSSSIVNPEARVGALKARDKVALHLEPIIQARRAQPGNDLLSDLASAEYDGEHLPVDEIVANLIFLLAAGIETTERVLTSTLRHLVLHPAEWDWLKAHYRDPERLSAFCAEALRFFPPQTMLVRQAMQDTTLGGQAIPAGDRIIAIDVSGNFDERRFDNPGRFDHDRFHGASERQYMPTGDILTFGKGTHHCIGSRLGQLEMMHAFTQLLDRVGRIEGAGELPEAGGFFLHSPEALPVILRRDG
jgi:cytochrome P450